MRLIVPVLAHPGWAKQVDCRDPNAGCSTARSASSPTSLGLLLALVSALVRRRRRRVLVVPEP